MSSRITLGVQNRPGDVCMAEVAGSPDWNCGLVQPKLYKDAKSYQSLIIRKKNTTEAGRNNVYKTSKKNLQACDTLLFSDLLKWRLDATFVTTS